MTYRRVCNGARRRGATVVEFALIAPLVFLFLLSIAELARAMMVSQALSSAARRAAREATLPGATVAQVRENALTALAAASVPRESIRAVDIQALNDGSGQWTDAGPLSRMKPRTRIRVRIEGDLSRSAWLPTTRWLSNAHCTASATGAREP